MVARRFGILVVLSALGCQPSIGDHCAQSTDCSATGQYLCDTSQPNGYCTLFNCRPNSCPSGAGCVVTNIAPLGCPYDDRHAPSRLARVLCLHLCNQDSDCRQGDGYACVAPADYGILVLDSDQAEKVCLAATDYVVLDAGATTAPVCSNEGPSTPGYDAGPGYVGDASLMDAGPDGGDAEADAGTDAADASSSD